MIPMSKQFVIIMPSRTPFAIEFGEFTSGACDKRAYARLVKLERRGYLLIGESLLFQYKAAAERLLYLVEAPVDLADPGSLLVICLDGCGPVGLLFDVVLIPGVRPYLTPNSILCDIYRHANKPRAEHFIVQYRILMMIELDESLLGDVLGESGVLHYAPCSPKDGPVVKRKRL